MALQHFANYSKSFQVSDGTTYGYVNALPTTSDHTFLLLHGFPGTSFDWRHHIPSLIALGYGVIAPDLLGYGDTDKPVDTDRYKLKTMAGHIADILKEEGRAKVIGVSHDWGSGLLSRLVNYYPELFEGLIFVSVPYMEPGTFDLDQTNALTEQIFGYPVFGYWKFFNEDRTAEICNKHNAAVTSLLYPSTPEVQKLHLCPYGEAEKWIVNDTVPEELPAWLSESEVAAHNSLLSKGGYTGPLNWYKAVVRGRNDEDEAAIPEDRKIVHLPTLFVNGDNDYVTRAEVAEQIAASGRLTNIKLQKIQGAGHWVYLEQKTGFLNILKTFAGSL